MLVKCLEFNCRTIKHVCKWQKTHCEKNKSIRKISELKHVSHFYVLRPFVMRPALPKIVFCFKNKHNGTRNIRENLCYQGN